MAPDKRNQFLDAEESDDEGSQGYDSEADEFQKGGRSAKRRRIDSEDEQDDDMSIKEDDLYDSEDNAHKTSSKRIKLQAEPDAVEGKTKAKREQDDDSKPLELLGVSKPLTKKNLVATEKAVKKSGVVYLSRIPPFMKPQKLRSLLSPYGQINRIFLAPEDPAVYTRRVRSGGNKKKSYTEGWVEFVNKKEAKEACQLLNAQTIGGKKGSYYRDDIWNLLYLNGFKWHNLTEQIAAENAERTSRMRAEISRTTKENKEFVRNVEQAKVLEGIQTKKAAKRKKLDGDETDDVGGVGSGISASEKARTFKQIPLANKKEMEGAQPERVQRVLSKIF
ncbi:putative pre-rrna-processing protein esf2 protein [Phaeoacremonium minimum UCRPA7]|uniref:18S rRNA factor 2 n=1 Tax=Phaeoacremonium minimum (strain UCR-PA7) TaxID=1286976 RepID=R8BE96_PHAM7|nr:putative pre-rrna-processing protein esf2 protein [Phaeoacremonium minimum UCRPA7]EON97626.1 putative pre-rrna-processing protein esf2 protein [Phaeoacremonium minimum UCRPA7]